MDFSWSWSPVGNHIKTKFASQVNTHPWPEYPRPQLTRGAWNNLNGLWDYAITDAASKEPTTFQGKILVPFPLESSLSGVGKVLNKNEVLWYKTQFISNVASNERLVLHFAAVDYESHVFVNGHNVGEHKGGYNRFSFDITKFVIPNKENTLVVKVIDTTSEAQPIGKQRHNPGGLFSTHQYILLSLYLGIYCLNVRNMVYKHFWHMANCLVGKRTESIRHWFGNHSRHQHWVRRHNC